MLALGQDPVKKRIRKHAQNFCKYAHLPRNDRIALALPDCFDSLSRELVGLENEGIL